MVINDVKIPRWITNISFFLSTFYVTRKKEGFFKAVKTLYSTMKIELYIYLYNNCSWFRNRILRNVHKTNPKMEPFVDIIFKYDPSVD